MPNPRREEGAWRDDPATDKQIEYLRSQGIKTRRRLTKGEAHLLIEGEPVTKKQLRRLKFYRIRPPKYLTKRDATDMIDANIAAHPESELKYRAWKIRRRIISLLAILIVALLIFTMLR